MSGKKAKAARRSAREPAPPITPDRPTGLGSGGHAFALIYHGKVLWYRDYWLPPYQTMYVQPSTLLADIPSA
jgi:hypothetical protein